MSWGVWDPLRLGSEDAWDVPQRNQTCLRLIQIRFEDDAQTVAKKISQYADKHTVVTFDRPMMERVVRARRWLAAVRPPMWRDIFIDQLRDHTLEGIAGPFEFFFRPRQTEAYKHVAVAVTFDGCFIDESLSLVTAIQQLDLVAPDASLHVGLLATVPKDEKRNLLAYSYNTRLAILSQCLTMLMADLGYMPIPTGNETGNRSDWQSGFLSIKIPSRKIRIYVERVFNNSKDLVSLLSDIDCIVLGSPKPECSTCGTLPIVESPAVSNMLILNSETYCDKILAKLPGIKLERYDEIERHILRAIIAPSLSDDGSIQPINSKRSMHLVAKLAQDLILR